MSTMLYVVSAEDIDVAALDLPVYIEAQAGGPMLGANNIAVVRCGGSRVDDGYEAIKAVYPDAVKTALKSKAIHLANSMRGGRLQVASNVSAETKAQVDELTSLGYSVRDIVTVGIELLHREKMRKTKAPVRDLAGNRVGLVCDMREQELHEVEDAIRIRRNALMVEKLKRAGIDARAEFMPSGADEPWYPSYILIYNSDGSLPAVWANLDECKRLLDTVQNLPLNEAFERWLPKVSEEETEMYTHADAIRDTKEARAQLQRDFEAGKFDGADHALLMKYASFMDLVK